MEVDLLEKTLTEGVLEIRGDGRAGSGLVLTLQSVASVAVADPTLHVQEWPFFSSARKGAPTRGFLRLSRKLISISSDITAPHIAIMMDEGVATMIDFAEGVGNDGVFILNTHLSPTDAAKRFQLSGHVYTIDGDTISAQFLKKPIGNISVFALLMEILPGFDPAIAKQRLEALLKKRRLPAPLVQSNIELFEASLGQSHHAFFKESQKGHASQIFRNYGELAPGAQSRLRLSRTNKTSAYARTGFVLQFADPQSVCNGCGHCIINCPENIIQFQADPVIGVRVTGADVTNYCKLCRECIAVCPKQLFVEVPIGAHAGGTG